MIKNKGEQIHEKTADESIKFPHFKTETHLHQPRNQKNRHHQINYRQMHRPAAIAAII